MKVGWIGTGIMGLPMCINLIKKGYQLNIFNRTKKKAKELINRGAIWCKSPVEVAKLSKVIFLMVGTPKDVENIIFREKGLLNNCRAGTNIIDMTTSSPELAISIYKEASLKGLFSLDAPVSGGDVGATSGTLAIMVGGDENVYNKNLNLLKVLGTHVMYMGTSGNGQHTKMSNQILVSGTMIGVVESLLYAQKVGIKLDDAIDVIGKGAASSWAINTLGRKIANRDFSPGFCIKHFVKDMGIALNESEKMSLALPGLALAKQFYTLAMARKEYRTLGTHAIYKILEKMNNVK